MCALNGDAIGVLKFSTSVLPKAVVHPASLPIPTCAVGDVYFLRLSIEACVVAMEGCCQVGSFGLRVCVCVICTVYACM